MVTASGTDEALADAVRASAADLVSTLSSASSAGSTREDWLALVGRCQSLVNTVTAVQDHAVAEVARREHAWAEDGTLTETVHAPGRVSIDAADLVAPCLGASHISAQRRVEQSVRLAAGRLPVEVDDHRPSERSGLSGLHLAMAAGDLDGYRAGVVAHELEGAPAEVADAIVSAVADHLGDDAPALRRRVRRLLARISPDLLRQRAQRARAATGLRRWVSEPGVDAWFGTFPSEDAAGAWSAVDRLAHQLVADGTCSSVEQARGRALTDLVTGNATVDVRVVLTVPAEATAAQHPGAAAPQGIPTTTADRHPEDLVELQGARPSEPLLVRRAWLTDHLATPATHEPCDRTTGARLDPGDAMATSAYRPGPRLVALVRARDGRCRFPGCSVAARFCDLDHVRPWPAGPTSAANLLCLCRRHHRVKQAAGWSTRLARNGTATWTDPTGRIRTTSPLDALHALVLGPDAAPVASGEPRAPDAGHASDDAVPAAPWSALETHAAMRLEHRPPHRRCTSAAALRAASARSRPRAAVHDPPPF
jgi:hypothetical protein